MVSQLAKRIDTKETGDRKAIRGWQLVVSGTALAAALTAILVLSGLDWAYFVMIQHLSLFGPLMVADLFGYGFPVLIMAGLFGAALRVPGAGYGVAGLAVLMSTALALGVSMALKAVAGRASPPHHDFGAALAKADISAVFNFGWMNESVLGGWPSSHATVAFAVAVTLVFAVPFARGLHVIALTLAAFIGIGVTFGFHWLSEFLSGALIGAAIGAWVGGSVAERVRRAERPGGDAG